MDSINALPKHTPTMNPANPVDIGYNVAVRHMAQRLLPAGWDEVAKFEDAPTTLQGITEYATRNGRLCIATEESDGTIFDCADTNVHLRAWHDSVHFRHQTAFNVAGEAATVYVQVAQLYRVFGFNEKTVRWASLLLADILGLVLHVKQTGKYPKNKRAGTVNAAPKWKRVAIQIAETCNALACEPAALELSKAEWGNYSE
jgi:hypothetical protein